MFVQRLVIFVNIFTHVIFHLKKTEILLNIVKPCDLSSVILKSRSLSVEYIYIGFPIMMEHILNGFSHAVVEVKQRSVERSQPF